MRGLIIITSSHSMIHDIKGIVVIKHGIYLIQPIQLNLNSSNTDCSFTIANSNSFLSPYKIFPIAQENKYLGKFSYFIMNVYVVCAH